VILFNVTVAIEKTVEAEWIQWMKQEYIPAVMRTGCFTNYRMYKVLTHDDEGSNSYAVQYFAETLDKFMYYLEHHEKQLLEEHRERFKDRHAAFRTLLEEV